MTSLDKKTKLRSQPRKPYIVSKFLKAPDSGYVSVDAVVRFNQAPVLPLRMKKPARKKNAAESSVVFPVMGIAAPVGMTPAPAICEASNEPPQARERADSLTLYMREVTQVPLLKREDEVVLARRIQAGDEQAREHMIRANLRLVVKIAREYEHVGLPLLDLINEGNLGLMKAVERFDPRKGAKLSTYSAFWIKQSIRRALANQSKIIRLPVHVVDKLYHVSRAAARFQQLHGREASETELAAELGISPNRISELRAVSARPASLDAPMGDDDSSRFADVIADESAAMPWQDIDRDATHEMLRELIGRLPERESAILRNRFGLGETRKLTLQAIGRKFGVTRERIRQLQNEALVKLRKMVEARQGSVVAA